MDLKSLFEAIRPFVGLLSRCFLSTTVLLEFAHISIRPWHVTRSSRGKLSRELKWQTMANTHSSSNWNFLEIKKTSLHKWRCPNEFIKPTLLPPWNGDIVKCNCKQICKNNIFNCSSQHQVQSPYQDTKRSCALPIRTKLMIVSSNSRNQHEPFIQWRYIAKKHYFL